MSYRGDYDTGVVVYGKFTTFRPSTGAPFTLAGTPALSVYKDNSTTQSTTGVTLTADFDSVTGLNHFAIDTSADGTFYSAGSNFDIVITTGTVDSVSVVGSVVASFSLRRASLSSARVDNIVDLVWDEVLTGATHNVTNSAGRRLRQVRSSLYSGTAQAGAANSITLDTGASATDNIYQGEIVSITGGTGAGQTRSIINYNGTTKVATVERSWITNPDATSTFEIVGTDERNIVQDGTAQAGGASTITLSSGATSTDDIYNGLTINITAGTGVGQSRLVTDYNGTTKVATITPAWTVQPDNTTIYQLLGVGQVIVASLVNDSITAAAIASDASAEIADAVLDDAVDGAVTLRQAARLWNSALGGKASGLETTSATYRDLGDTKNRITATVDADGNRTAVTLDLT